MDTTITEIPTTPGTPFAGGFYAGRIRVDGAEYALIVAPRGEGEHEPSSMLSNPTPEHLSFYDGAANTSHLNQAGCGLAAWARSLQIGGFDDWYLPSRDELEILYRAFKPTDDENYCWRGDNPSSIPPGYAYSPAAPAQTPIAAFQEGGAEAFAADWYWSSTQDAGAPAYAWYQHFDDGGQDDGRKDGELRARAVRRLKV